MAETEPFVWQLINVFTQKATNVYKPKLTVGRCKDVDIVSLSTAASRSHAEFILSEDGCLKVKDLNVRKIRVSKIFNKNLWSTFVQICFS